MTYDQIVLLLIPILVAVGALLAAYSGAWLYPAVYTSGSRRAEAEVTQFEIDTVEVVQEVRRQRAPQPRSFISYPATAPGYAMAARNTGSDEYVVKEKLPSKAR